MPWMCYMVEPVIGSGGMFSRDGEMVPWSKLEPGAMWFDGEELFCKIPGGSAGSEWMIDRGRMLNEDPTRVGKKKFPQWTRTGDPPKITANPSINYVGFYHGWLRDGVLSDDCEGRVL